MATRFEHRGRVKDLDRTIEVDEKVVGTLPEGHPDRAGYLSKLGTDLSTRFVRTGRLEDLDRAIDVIQEAGPVWV